MVRKNERGLQLGDTIENADPALDGRLASDRQDDKLVLHDVAGNQHLVRLDEKGDVAVGVRDTEILHPYRDITEVQGHFLVKQDVGLIDTGIDEQFFVDVGTRPEKVDHAGAGFLDLLLLDLIADHDGVSRKAALSRDMLGVKMRGGEIQLAALAQLFDYSRDGSSVALAESGIDNERAVAANHDPDIWIAEDRPDMGGQLLGVFVTEHDIFRLLRQTCHGQRQQSETKSNDR